MNFYHRGTGWFDTVARSNDGLNGTGRVRSPMADTDFAKPGPLMAGKGRVIQEASSGGRSFFRLRVSGFTSRDDARRFCAAFRSGGQCVPALVR